MSSLAPISSPHFSLSVAQNEYSKRISAQSYCTCIQKIFIVFWNAIKSCIDFFTQPFSKYFCPLRSVLGQKDYYYISPHHKTPLIKGQRLTRNQREHRIRMGRQDVQERLRRELQHAQNQMANEPEKAFVYQEAPAHFSPPIHEETVGNYQVGICHYQGRRATMEDEHLATQFNITIDGHSYPISLFGIFDGHGGSQAAQYVRDNLQTKLMLALIEFRQNGLTDVGIWNALKITCVRLNQDFLKEHPDQARNTGTTATFALIVDDKLWMANVGDSRIILDGHGQLTEDAKPDDPRYRRNIEQRGGYIRLNDVWRVNGDLACARSIGDNRLNGAVSARPKITMIPLSRIPPASNLYIGCDGIFDVASTRQILQAGSNHRNATPGAEARNFVYSAYQSGAGDNLSMLVVRGVR